MSASIRELPTAVASSITTEIMRVTPAMAEKMLGKNVRNRHISQPTVDKYRRAMTSGEWLITGEAIKFASNGDLLDGQHRLAAVVASGKTVSLVVIKGLPQAAQDVMDTGRARRVGDQLGISGYPNPVLLASVTRLVILYNAGQLSSNMTISTPETLTMVENNALIAFATSRAYTISKGCDLRPSVAGATFYELMKVNDVKAQEFFDRLTDGVNLPAGSPLLALRARLRALRDDRTRLPNEALVSLVFRTWNAWRARRSLTSLPLYRNGELIPCPVPK